MFTWGPYSNSPSVDPYWDDVVLLLTCEGTTADSSPTTKTVTNTGAASSTDALFGAPTVYFDGASHLVVAHHTDLHLPGDFTIEYFVKRDTKTLSDNSPGTNGVVVKRLMDTSATGTWGVATFKTPVGPGFEDHNAFYDLDGVHSYGLAEDVQIGTWAHIAMVREGTDFRVYFNGVNPYTAGLYTLTVDLTNAYDMYVGAWGRVGSGGPLEGFLCGNLGGLRITKGVARYSGNFSPLTERFPVGGP